jgi:hypothetical protein
MFLVDTYYCIDFANVVHEVDEIDFSMPWKAIWYCDSKGQIIKIQG